MSSTIYAAARRIKVGFRDNPEYDAADVRAELDTLVAALDDTPTKTAERNAARVNRDQCREEIVLMLGWLTRRYPVIAHLAPARTGAGWQVVCVHEGERRLTWRVSDLDVLAWFEHLTLMDCQSAGTRDEKLAALADLAASPPHTPKAKRPAK